MPTKIAFVGVGDISGIYLKNIFERFNNLEVVGVCDLEREKAERAVKQYGIPKLYNDMYELFADPEVDIVLNITRPYEHYAVSKAALLAGKPVYSEKPLAATLEEGRELAALAAEKNLYLGGAPDTFLGAGIQGCRRFIEEGLIGEPVGFAAHMICHGHETWHVDPAFYYKHGGGQMLDMGPYYVTALVNLLGPVKSVMGMTKITYPTRLITSKPHCGEVVDVVAQTHYTGLMRFANGATGTIIMTFDAYSMPGKYNIEIYGSKGNMTVPDPNNFSGEILVKLGERNSPNANEVIGNGQFIALDTPFEAYDENSRALGLADMAEAIQDGRKARAGVEQTLHVLEVLTAFQRSSESGREIEIEAPYEPAPPMPDGEPIWG